MPALFLTLLNKPRTWLPLKGRCFAPLFRHTRIPSLILKGRDASPCPCNFLFQSFYCVSVFFTYILFYVFSKYDQGIVILFHATHRTLYVRLEPFHDTFRVEHMFATQLFIGPFCLFEAYSASMNGMHLTLSILDRWTFTFFSRYCK